MSPVPAKTNSRFTSSRGLTAPRGPAKRTPGSWFANGVHLDCKLLKHHDAVMRTTVTLDKDVERMLQDSMHRERRSFKETLNDAVRAGLGARRAPLARRPFRVQAKAMGLRSGFDPAGFNKLTDDLDVEAQMERSHRSAAP